MKKLLVIICGAVLILMGFSTPSHAIPELQLYIEGSTYDTTAETWVLQTSNPIKLWVIGNVGAVGAIDGVKLSIAYEMGLAPSFSLVSTTTGGYGGFTDLSTPASAGSPRTVTDGSAPLLSDGSSLPAHGIFGSGTAWQEFALGDFNFTDSPIADFINTFPTPSSALGQINVYEIAVSGITEGFTMHFDVYDHYYNKKGAKAINAPFSHDAEDPPPQVPEPITMLLLGLGLMGLAGLKKKIFNKTI